VAKTVEASKEPAVNLMNKKRRLSIESNAPKDYYHAKSPVMANAKAANEKLALSASNN
jgi:hypothetical protein